MTQRRRIGILGGTFDPVHIGHLHIAQCARHELELDQVVFMPAGSPPHKPDHPMAPASMRLEMVDIAIRGRSGLVSSDLDLQSDSPSFTNDLLRNHATAHPEADVWFVIGSDSLQDFPGWHEPASILRQARLAVAARPGWPVNRILEKLHMPDLKGSVDEFTTVPIDLSATAIRSRIQQGLPVDWLLPSDVLDFIQESGLYRDESQADVE